MGVYSMDLITRYINFYEIIKQKNGNYPFAIFNTDNHNQSGTNWWGLWIFITEKTYFYLMN